MRNVRLVESYWQRRRPRMPGASVMTTKSLDRSMRESYRRGYEDGVRAVLLVLLALVAAAIYVMVEYDVSISVM